ncbi:MAG: HD domain-containing protein [Oscillospiraceae bacterium]|nr:HD domain-containing protein [Oscillospiraceae bacterium]
MAHYDDLPQELQARILADRKAGWVNPYRTDDSSVIRREERQSDQPKIYRMPFSKDADKILNSLFYSRYADKTQVFSFYRNDDLSRRALHVQLVSRIARNIGAVLGLNADLIEAIAIGHDMGHTPFGHAGERALHALFHARTGRCFRHNLHSVRVLDAMIPYNISMQTLDGILCHNGELPLAEYTPRPLSGFAAFDQRTEECTLDENGDKKLIPMTLEGCLVRICDMLAYLGKDRQDAIRAKLIPSEDIFSQTVVGRANAEVINNLEVNLIQESYGKPYLRLDDAHFEALKTLKKENYEQIYLRESVQQQVQSSIVPMMEQLYERIRADAAAHTKDSCLYRHHILPVMEKQKWYPTDVPYADTDPDQLTVDFIAAMTDDYFVDYYNYLFPKSAYRIQYHSYFEEPIDSGSEP